MVANFIPSPVGGKACRANAFAEHSDACLKPPTITYVILAGPGPHPGKEQMKLQSDSVLCLRGS